MYTRITFLFYSEKSTFHQFALLIDRNKTKSTKCMDPKIRNCYIIVLIRNYIQFNIFKNHIFVFLKVNSYCYEICLLNYCLPTGTNNH